ncbi:uncharacterized protein UV8b_01466 [Ustilaginoidea virens]|uniref:Xylitol dehydrogenase n=1 Tax=Ustilaginoidea virens TaxID=1159556 RepID=A0A8E5HKP2_USTVR|nr:uncharacterized protein UV8b_01466 [Ustilaginoidea virens]QUC17225.1 hypothetical protein UV8b_01466 [Ustilaginoidea virens]
MNQIVHKIKKSLGHDTRPAIPLADPKVQSPAAARPDDKHSPRLQPSSSPPCENHNVRDAAHSPPSVLSQHLGPPIIEHNYPKDSKWRRHSISAQEQHYLR